MLHVMRTRDRLRTTLTILVSFGVRQDEGSLFVFLVRDVIESDDRTTDLCRIRDETFKKYMVVNVLMTSIALELTESTMPKMRSILLSYSKPASLYSIPNVLESAMEPLVNTMRSTCHSSVWKLRTGKTGSRKIRQIKVIAQSVLSLVNINLTSCGLTTAKHFSRDKITVIQLDMKKPGYRIHSMTNNP